MQINGDVIKLNILLSCSVSEGHVILLLGDPHPEYKLN